MEYLLISNPLICERILDLAQVKGILILFLKTTMMILMMMIQMITFVDHASESLLLTNASLIIIKESDLR
jgi:hypothetical protein